MLYINKAGDITINRGDTFQVPLFIDISDKILQSTRFPLHEGDKVLFHITNSNMPFECPLIAKTFTIDDINENKDILVRFEHDDTKWLHPDTYYYEIKLIRESIIDIEDTSDSSGEIETIKDYVTIAPRRKFIIL